MALGRALASYGFRFDTGRVCLDLLATSHPEERLVHPAALCAWTIGAGLVPAGTLLGHVDAGWLLGFRELRGVIGELIRAEDAVTVPRQYGARGKASGVRPYGTGANVGGNAVGNLVGNAIGVPPYDAALARVNDLARVAPPAPRAVRTHDGTLAGRLAAPPERAALLAAVARDTVDLLTDPAARSRLRQCEGDNCPIVYLDASRGRRRRWCSSEVCGNRERVARHRRRTAVTQA